MDNPTQIKVDSKGNVFNNVIQLCGGGPAATSGWATAALKSDGTVWVWGNTTTGMRGDGTYGGNDASPVQVPFPAGVVIKKIQFDYIGIALDQSGNVWTWGGSGIYQSPYNLGQGTSNPDYNTPHKIALPAAAKDIAGGYLWHYALLTTGQLYGWGFFNPYLGIGTGGIAGNSNQSYSPQLLDGQLNLPHQVSKIYTNNSATYAILTDSTLWAWGDNATGAIGNGQEINYATYNPAYAWDWGMGELMVQKPVQIAAGLHSFTDVWVSSALCFYAYAEDAKGQLYAWGRNKGGVIANGVVEADGIAGILGGNYPNSWDVPYITAINPFSNKAIPSPSPFCLGNPGVAGCSLVKMLVGAVPNVSAGPDQNINTSTTTLQGTASGNAGAVPVYTIWSQVSGPSNALITIPSGLSAQLSGLVAGTYVFKLTVTDNYWKVNSSTVTITVGGVSTAPTVNAGSAQTITLPVSSVNLTGTVTASSGNSVASTKWTQVSGPNTATIAAAGSLTTAASGLVAGTYVFQLTATDNKGLTGSATVTITVNAAAVPPTASAGGAQTITLPTNSATLTGSATANGGATIASTTWTQTSGPGTATISSPSSLSTAVGSLVAGTYVFQLTVKDNNGLTSTASVSVTVKAAVAPPTVDAGSAQTITLPVSTATLTGTATGNGGATIASTTWTQTGGPGTATIASPAALSTTVSSLVAGVYTFKLTAKDNNGQTASANVTVTVKAASVAPTVSAGSAQTITLPTSSVILTGTASAGSGWSIATTAWTQVSGPNTATIQSAVNLKTVVSGLVQGSYVFQLSATDNNNMTGTATVTVTVNAGAVTNVPPTASAGNDVTIQLPTSSVALSGSAIGNGGATISSTVWTQVSGPGTAVITGGTGLAPTVSGLVAGAYVFQLTAKDNNGLAASDNVNVVVNAANIAPTANAGSGQNIQLPVSSVDLSGTATGNGGGTIVSTVWTQVSGPVQATISGAQGLNPQASGLTVAGSYVFKLTVKDNHGLTATATVTVVVSAADVAPTVSAGTAQSITLPVNSVTLSGSAAGNGGATIASSIWTQVSGPNAAVFAAAGHLSTLVSGLTAGTYVFQLGASDNHGLASYSTVTVTVHPAAVVPPTVSAGSDVSVQLPTSSVKLTGTAQANGGATIVSTVWKQVGGPAVATLTGANTLQLSVSNLTVAGTYTFQLIATDNNGSANSATVKVTVLPLPPNQPPVANAGSDQTITQPTATAKLDGTKSYDADGNIAAYNWYQGSGKGGVTIANSNTATPTVSGLVPGQYSFVLVVTDNSGATAQDEMSITVNASGSVTPTTLVADAGKDTTLVLPASSTVLDGSASSASGSSITAYNWTLVSGPVGSDIANPDQVATSVTGLQGGLYMFRLTVQDDKGDTASATVKVRVMSVTRHGGDQGIFIFPNPAHDVTNVQINTSVEGVATMTIFSLGGGLADRQTMSLQEGTTTIPVNVSKLSGGVYFIHVILKDGSVIRTKLVKQ
ncbi:MAG TPA: PKD domain-containing protein [Puia sp.]|uniref:PKD domain-containing protein n=1 Tax=Puia sp. TaxID=2045100 RepID=UPI002D0CA534|nr:PKD domain-containing protein [Puia sp.]HVU95078.1 PKD domain-containing protein [Puia sp.]